MEEIVKIFKALGDETRLKILIIVSKRNICAKGLARHLNISEAAVSQHLKILKDAGVVVGEKMGYYVNYKLQKHILEHIINVIDEIKEDIPLSCCNFDLHMSNICNTACEGRKNRCCKKSEI